MTAQLKAWGNSGAIRLPKNILEVMDLRLDDYISIEVTDVIEVTDAVQSIFDY